MAWNIRMVSTYPPRRCGIGTFSRDLCSALAQFPGEVGAIRMAAIDNRNGPYTIPIDLVIDQYSPRAWKHATREIIARAKDSPSPSAIVFQHEFGLDPDPHEGDARGRNYVDMVSACAESGLITLVYLHTVLEKPNTHQRQVIRELAARSDGLVVTTESAIDILESEAYAINPFKLKHIDHGVRMQNPSDFDRYKIKSEFGINDKMLITTLGLLSPGKGIPYSIRAYGRFLQESCTTAQREHIVYLVAGQCHPDFIKEGGGGRYRLFMDSLHAALREAQLRWQRTSDLSNVDWAANDVVFLETFLDESTLLKLYGATNAMVLPYLDTEQISSGILADTIGAGRVAIASKFRYALELIYSNKTCPPGVVIGRFARGILVDPGPPSVEQIAQAIDYIVFEKGKRLRIERQAHQRGYQMRWVNSAWALIQYLNFINEEKVIPQGRGMTFLRKKPSALMLRSGPSGRPLRQAEQPPGVPALTK